MYAEKFAEKHSNICNMSENLKETLEKYEVLKSEVARIIAKLHDLKTKFKSYNKNYRAQVVEKFLSEKNEEEKKFEKTNKELIELNKDKSLDERSYFKTDANTTVLNLFKDLTDLLKQSQKAEEVSESESEHSVIEEVETKMSKPGHVQKICNSIIVNFDPKRIRPFINSVEMALDEFEDDEDIRKVINYAKLKVVNCTKIEVSEYEKFDDLKKDLLAYFKPQKSLEEVSYQISKLQQQANQNVEKYSKYVSDLKCNYEDAKAAKRGKNVDADTLAEMEEEVVQAFIRGLKGAVAMNLKRRDAGTLHEAIQLARDAETTARTKADNLKLEELRKPKNQQNNKTTNNFRRDNTSKSSDKPAEKRVSVTACRYCKEEGHWVKDCPKLKEKNSKSSETAIAARVESRVGNEKGNIQKNVSSGEQCFAPQNAIKARWANSERFD